MRRSRNEAPTEDSTKESRIGKVGASGRTTSRAWTVEPSGRPAWKKAMANLYPLIVEIEEFLSIMETRKSAILPKEAVYGSHKDWEHHLRKPASLLS